MGSYLWPIITHLNRMTAKYLNADTWPNAVGSRMYFSGGSETTALCEPCSTVLTTAVPFS